MPDESGASVEASGIQFSRLLELLRLRGGIARRNDLVTYGVTSNTIHAALGGNLIERVARGVYRVAGTAPFGTAASFAQAVLAVPQGVICLTSALVYHDLTTQIPTTVYVAVSRRTRAKNVAIPIGVVHMPLWRFTHEVEHAKSEHGERFPVFSITRSICDAFHFTKYVPDDVAYEALRAYLVRPDADPVKLVEQARLTKTAAIIEPVVRAHFA